MPIFSGLSSLKDTVEVPLPPDLVVTMMSPLSFLACPTRHTILLADIHSAVRRQLCPQIVRPMRSAGPVPRFSPRIVTFVHGMPSFGEMPVTRGGCRDRDIVLVDETRSRYRNDLQARRTGPRAAAARTRTSAVGAPRPSIGRATERRAPDERASGAGRGGGRGWETGGSRAATPVPQKPRTDPRLAAATRSPRGRGASGQEP